MAAKTASFTDTIAYDTTFTNATGALSFKGAEPISGETTGSWTIGGVVYTHMKVGSYGTFYSKDGVAGSMMGGTAGSYLYVPDAVKINAATTTVTDVFSTTATTADTLTVTINGVNDTPVLDASKSPILTGQAADAGAPSGAVGTLVSSLIDFSSKGGVAQTGGLDNVSDADGNALLGIALTAVDSTNGSWLYSTDGGASWTAVGAVSATNALLLKADASTLLYFQSNAGFFGTVANAITFKAWDQSAGTAGSYATTATGSQFSTASDTASIAIANASNNAPVFTSSPVSLSYTDTAALDAFSNSTGTLTATDADGNTLTYGVAGGTVSGGISTLVSTYGTLAVNTATGDYTFTPNATAINGLSVSATPSFIVTVNDGQVTTNQTLTLNLTGANDAPVLDATKSPAFTASFNGAAPSGAVGTLISSLVDFATPAGQVDNVTDADTGASLGVAITATDSNGTWWYSTNAGSTWTAVGAVSANSALLLVADANTRLYLQPTSGYIGNASLTIKAWDQSSGIAGNKVDTSSDSAFSTATDTVAVTVAPSGAYNIYTDTAAADSFVDWTGTLSGTGADTITGGTSGSWTVSGTTYTDMKVGTYGTLYVKDGASGMMMMASATAGTYRYVANAAAIDALSSGMVADVFTVTSGSANTLSVYAQGANDAPVLDASKTPVLADQEGTTSALVAPTGAVGTLVSTLVDFSSKGGAAQTGGLDNVSDADSNAQLGIALTGVNAIDGNWFYSTDNGANWTAIGILSDANALLLTADANTRVYFQSNTNYSGTIADAITFKAWDQSSGQAATTVDTTSGSQFSTAADTASITIHINTAPDLTAPAHIDVYDTGVWNTVSVLPALTNPSFETGDLTGWTTQGIATVETFYSNDFNYVATDGSQFLKLEPTTAEVFTTASTSLTLLAGQIVSGKAAFDSGDNPPWNDRAYVHIVDSQGNVVATPWTGDTSVGSTDWTNWSWTAPDNGTYTVEYGVANGLDDTNPSYGLFDQLQVANGADALNVTTGMLSATDAQNDTISYGIQGGTVSNGISTLVNSYGSLSVNIVTGAYTFTPDAVAVNALAANATTIASFTVTASDGALTSTRPLDIHVMGANDAPVITSTATGSVAENAAVNTVIYTAVATDVDAGDTHTYSLSGTDAALLNINANTGAVTLKASADFETKASYDFTVVATDAGGLTAEKAVTVGVTNVNEAPVITSGATGSVAENAAISTVIYTVAATDVDAGDTVTYSLNGTDAALLNINTSTGEVTLKASADYESKASYNFTVVATDMGGLTAAKAVTVGVTNVNEAPVITSGTTGTVAENAPISTVIYAAAASDVDAADTLTYSLNGTDAALLDINASTGAVTLKASANYESKASYNFTVVTTDAGGLTTEKAVTVGVTNVNEAPVITSGVTGTVAENAPISTVIYTVAATDVDAGDTHTYSLSGADAALLNINASTGAVTLKASANFETNASYDFTVVATDAGGLTDTKAVTVGVTNVNEAPVITSGATGSVAENAAISTVIYTAATSDVDAGDTHTYSLKASGDAALLDINASTGAVTLKTSADFETKASYNFTVVTTDAGGLSAEKAVTVGVTNVNEAPVITSTATGTVAENAPISTVIYTATATDVDAGDTHTYSLSGTDAALLNINASTGAVTLKASADFETNASYDFTVVATDAGGLIVEKAVTVGVTNVNEAPVITSGTTGFVVEDAPISTVIYTVAASDVDASDTVTYSVNGTDAALLDINASTGAVTLKASANFASKASYDFTVAATDAGGLTDAKAVVVSVSNVNHAPVITSTATGTVAENAAISTVIYTALASDVDVGDTRAYSLKATGDASLLDIDANTGEVTLKASADFETKASYNFTVVATDIGGLSAEKAVAVNVTNINEAPVFTSTATGTVAENAAISTVIYTAVASDVDAGDSRTYSLSGADAALLDINASTGAVTLKASADFETKANYDFTVVATDAGGLSAEKAVAVGVTNVNEAPVITSTATGSVAENAPISTVIYTTVASDVDVGDTLTYSLKAATGDVALLDINASTGEVTLKASANYESKASYGFTVVTTDAGGLTAEKAVTVAVTNVNEAPVITSTNTGTVVENAPISTVIYTAVATDVDAGDTRIFSLGGTDAALLNINASTGAVTLKAPANFASKASYDFTVVATDAGGLTAEKSVTVGVTTTVNAAPVLTAPAAINYIDTAVVDSFATQTGNLLASDVDSTGLTYGITGGTVSSDGLTVSKSNAYGVLTVTIATGAYSFAPNAAAIEPLNSNVSDATLLVTVSDGQLTASKPLVINITQSGVTESLGNDILVGTAGNDTINGLTGADKMTGGLGNDVYYVDNIGDVVTEISTLATEIDSVYSSVSYILGANVENLTLTGTAAINATGNALNNILTGNSAANVLSGGLGSDTYYVNNMDDMIIESGAGTDQVFSTVSYTLSANIEKLTLVEGSAAISGTGNTAANTLTGNSANNILNGGGGVDTMIGGDGDDTYYVDSTTDVITENNTATSGIDTVYATATYTLGANLETLILDGTTAINGTGNTADNTLTGNSANNTLTANAGNDLLTGGAGADILIGGLGKDTYDLAEPTAAIDTVRIAAGDSLVSSYDVVQGFRAGTGVGTTGVDKLDLATIKIAANAATVNGVDSGTIMSHHISSGIISFDDINTYTAPVAITSANLADVVSYLQANITGTNTVAFVAEGNTFVFQDGGVTDTLVELVGVTAGSVSTTGTVAGSVWIM